MPSLWLVRETREITFSITSRKWKSIQIIFTSQTLKLSLRDCFIYGGHTIGGYITMLPNTPDDAACMQECFSLATCNSFTYNIPNQYCYLKAEMYDTLPAQHNMDWTGGPKSCNWTASYLLNSRHAIWNSADLSSVTVAVMSLGLALSYWRLL